MGSTAVGTTSFGVKCICMRALRKQPLFYLQPLPFMVHMLENTYLLVWLALIQTTKDLQTPVDLHESVKVNQPSNRLP